MFNILDQLANLSSENFIAKPTAVKAAQTVTDIPGHIRISSKGTIRVSSDFVNEFGLEYGTDNAGYGLDVFESKDWYKPTAEGQPASFPLLFAVLVKRPASKIRLFQSTKKEGMSIFDQQVSDSELATIAFGLYSKKAEEKFIDFNLVPAIQNRETLIVAKTIARGEQKGAPSYVVRNPKDGIIYILERCDKNLENPVVDNTVEDETDIIVDENSVTVDTAFDTESDENSSANLLSEVSEEVSQELSL